MKKSLLGLFLIALMASLCIFGAAQFGKAQSGTNVNGIITTDTTWTKANSPYNITGTIQIPANIMLVIEPGVVITSNISGTSDTGNRNPNMFLVAGSVIAQGTVNNEIVFDGGGNSNIFTFIFTTSMNASIDLSYCSIGNGKSIFYDGGAGNVNLTHCQVSGMSAKSYVYLNSRQNVNVEYNTFSNSDGFLLNDYDANICIEYNLFNGKGPSNDSDFIESSYCQTGAQTDVHYNSFLNMTGIILELPPGATYTAMNASQNYWGTTNTTMIASMIYDQSDDLNCWGLIPYLPILTSPNCIIASANSHGSIIPNGAINLNYGDNQAFTITPTTGYIITDVLVNGTSVGAVGSYTIQNVTGMTSILATFAPNPTPTPTSKPAISTQTYLNVIPNPVGVGQIVTISFGLYQSPPSGNGWTGITVKAIYPDGTIATLGPFTTNATGNTFTAFTPPQVGNFSFQALFPGEAFNGTYYEPSNSNMFALEVQQQPQQSPTPSPALTTTPLPTSTPKPTPSPTPVPTPNLSFYCISSTTTSGFSVQIQGSLSYNGKGLSGAGIQLSDSITGGATWENLTYVNTDNKGSFTCVWNPSASGNYAIEAAWPGDSTYSSVSTIDNFAVAPFNNQEQNIFSVTSNSTLTSLTFDSTTNQLSFGVSGPSGTTGQTEVCIPQSLIPDVSKLNVMLDGASINYNSVSEGNVWLITFTYHHSSHTIIMGLDSTQSSAVPEFPSQIVVLLAIIVATSMIGLMLRKNKISKS